MNSRAAEYPQENEMLFVIIGDKKMQLGPVSEFTKAADKGDVVQSDIYGNQTK